jgi:hypothetical protein
MRGTPSTYLLVSLALVACGKEEPKPGPPRAAPAPRQVMPPAPAEYQVVLKSTWTARNHPFEYPSGAHFSGLIGASHNANYEIFELGSRPTPGLERLSEEGKHSPLDDEIDAAIKAGNAFSRFETGGLKKFRDSLRTTVRVDAKHPMVSVVAMLAPSPDWFTGVSSVNLAAQGGWVQSRTLVLYAFDSGGDDGTTYKANDRNTNPKKATSRAATRHFVVNGKVKPVAILVLTRQSP